MDLVESHNKLTDLKLAQINDSIERMSYQNCDIQEEAGTIKSLKEEIQAPKAELEKEIQKVKLDL